MIESVCMLCDWSGMSGRSYNKDWMQLSRAKSGGICIVPFFVSYKITFVGHHDHTSKTTYWSMKS